MASPSSSSHLKDFALPAFLMVFAVAIFRLPFYFPVSDSVSASYVFQYNNRVALLIFLGGAAAFAILFRGLSLEPATRDSRVSRKSFLLAAAFCIAVGLLFYWLSGPGGLEVENMYFLSRLNQLSAGRTIYRDFEFAYGPLWLYLPFWTGKLLHVSLIAGYTVFWLLDWATGVWILFRLVNAIDIPSPHRTVIFFVFVLDFAQALRPQGINYAPVRVLLTAGLAMLVYELHKRRYPPAIGASVSVLCAAFATAVSPEQGIAFMLGSSLFFFCVRKPRAEFWTFIAIMGPGFLAILVISQWAGVYTSLRAFSSGGNNLPIMPYPSILCVIGLYLVASCVAYLAFKRKRSDSISIYLLCICLFSMSSGFGRADQGHMQVGGFSAMIIAALTLSRYPRVALLAVVAFFSFNATPEFHGEFRRTGQQVERRVFNPSERKQILFRATVRIFHLLHFDARRTAIEVKVAQFYDLQRTVAPELPAGAIVNAPWGLTRSGYVDDSGKVDYGYFFGLENVLLPPQVDSIIRWLQAHPERKVIFPFPVEKRCYSYDEGDDPKIRNWYRFRWASPKRQMRVLFPLCDFVRTHYAPDDIPFSRYVLLYHPIIAAQPSEKTATPTANAPLPLQSRSLNRAK